MLELSRRQPIGSTEEEADAFAFPPPLLSLRAPQAAPGGDYQEKARTTQEVSDRVTLLRDAIELLLSRQ